MSGIRARAKRQMRERSRHHFYTAGFKLKKGRRYEFRLFGSDGRELLRGWFVADRPDPECHL